MLYCGGLGSQGSSHLVGAAAMLQRKLSNPVVGTCCALMQLGEIGELGVAELGEIGNVRELGVVAAWKASTWQLPAGRCCTDVARKLKSGRGSAAAVDGAEQRPAAGRGSCTAATGFERQLSGDTRCTAAAAAAGGQSSGMCSCQRAGAAALLRLGRLRSSHQAGAAVLPQGKLGGGCQQSGAVKFLPPVEM